MDITDADFTPNEIIDSIQIGDNTIDIIGYVTKSSNNLMSPKKCKFQKVVVNNGQGREVQVVAWNDNVPILENIKEIGTIVHMGALKATNIKNKNYNNGNVNFELLVKENSTIQLYGLYNSNIDDNSPEEVSISEAYTKVGKKIKVEGIIKNEFRVFSNQDIHYVLGAITDCTNKLEIKIYCDVSTLTHFQKGDSVHVIGTIESYPPGPVMLRADSIEDITKIDQLRVQFIDIYQGFHNKA